MAYLEEYQMVSEALYNVKNPENTTDFSLKYVRKYENESFKGDSQLLKTFKTISVGVISS